MTSPRSQIEMLETSFEDVFLAERATEPRLQSSVLPSDCLRPRISSDDAIIKLHRRLYFSNGSESGSSIGLNTALLGATSSPISFPEKFETNPALMSPDEWSLISNNAITIAAQFKALAEEETDNNWYADDFDLRTSHCPWLISSLELPALDSSYEASPFDFNDMFTAKLLSTSGLSFDLLRSPAARNMDVLIEMDDSLSAGIHLASTPTQNDSYLISKNNDSYVIAKNSSYVIAKNSSYTISTDSSPPMEMPVMPGSAKKNSSFSEAAEKFLTLRRSMSSDSVMPLSQEKIRGLSLTTRALVPDSVQSVPSAMAVPEPYKNAVADFKLRPGKPGPAAKPGPMRAMRPLGEMMRSNAAAVETSTPPASAQRESSQPRFAPTSPAVSDSVKAPLASTPIRGKSPPLARRSISASPVRRTTPLRSPSSGYGQRIPDGSATKGRAPLWKLPPVVATRPAASARVVKPVVVPVVKPDPAARKKPADVAARAAAPMASRLKWPTVNTGAVKKAAALSLAAAPPKGVPKPSALAVCDSNVRPSRINVPLRPAYLTKAAVIGKENK